MGKRWLALGLALLLFTAPGCFTFDHQVGGGASGKEKVAERQWFALWGLVRVNHVDAKTLAGGASDYTVRTQWAPLDVVINIFTSLITFYSQTVTVTK